MYMYVCICMYMYVYVYVCTARLFSTHATPLQRYGTDMAQNGICKTPASVVNRAAQGQMQSKKANSPSKRGWAGFGCPKSNSQEMHDEIMHCPPVFNSCNAFTKVRDRHGPEWDLQNACICRKPSCAGSDAVKKRQIPHPLLKRSAPRVRASHSVGF